MTCSVYKKHRTVSYLMYWKSKQEKQEKQNVIKKHTKKITNENFLDKASKTTLNYPLKDNLVEGIIIGSQIVGEFCSGHLNNTINLSSSL